VYIDNEGMIFGSKLIISFNIIFPPKSWINDENIKILTSILPNNKEDISEDNINNSIKCELKEIIKQSPPRIKKKKAKEADVLECNPS